MIKNLNQIAKDTNKFLYSYIKKQSKTRLSAKNTYIVPRLEFSCHRGLRTKSDQKNEKVCAQL